MMRVIVMTLTGDLEEDPCQAVIYEKLLGTCCQGSRGLYYSYSGEVASLLNTPIFSKFIKKLNQFYKKTQV